MVHQELDEEGERAPPRGQERRAQVGAGEAGPEPLHALQSLLGISPGLGGEPQRAVRHGELVERVGLAGPVAHGLPAGQDLLEDGDGLPHPAGPDQRPPPQAQGSRPGLEIDLLQPRGLVELAERGGGVAAIEIDLRAALPADRLLRGVVQLVPGELQGLPVQGESPVQLAELAQGGAQSVQGVHFSGTVLCRP